MVKAPDSLMAWGNLRADPDTGRVTAVENFSASGSSTSPRGRARRRRRPLAGYDEALGQRGALHAVALHDIATTLSRHVPWRPWRYTVHDYRAALAHAGPGLRPLGGKPACRRGNRNWRSP